MLEVGNCGYFTWKKQFTCIYNCSFEVMGVSGVNHQDRRHLSLHEYLSFGLLKEAKVPIPKFKVCDHTEEVEKAARDLCM